MMACSYLSAGSMKSELSSAACWSPPAMTPDTRPIALALPTAPSGPMTLPSGPMAVPIAPMSLPSGPLGIQPGLDISSAIGLPCTSLGVPRASIPQRGPPGHLGLESAAGLPSRPMGLLNTIIRPVRLPSVKTGLPSAPTGLPSGLNAQVGLPPPLTRPLPMDLGRLPQSGSSSEPALDLSTSGSTVTSPIKPKLPLPEVFE